MFIGPPGSGKGSLARLCQEKWGWENLSTGDLCRQHIADKTEIGKHIDFALKSGILVSDELITDMVAKWLASLADDVNATIMDGYPRTVEQARLFNELIRNNIRSLTLKIVKFFINDKVIINRLSHRYICENTSCQTVYSTAKDSPFAPRVVMMCDKCSSHLIQRKDDQPHAIKERLKIYHEHAKDLIDFYLNNGYSVVEINGEKTLQQVFEEFKKVMCLNGV